MKLLWFKFYWQNFSVGVKGFSNAQIGGYMRLLIHQWDKGFLVNDVNVLKKISNLSERNLLIVKEKFKLCEDGNLRNERLDNERNEAVLFHESQKNSGKKGAKKRWQAYSDPNGKPIANKEVEEEIEERKKKERKTSAAKEKIFEMFCRILKGKLTDTEIETEAAKFINKYPDIVPSRAANLVNTWSSNLLENTRTGESKWWHAI